MGTLNKEQIVEYIKKLESRVKKLQVIIKSRDEEISRLRTRLSTLVNGESHTGGDMSLDAEITAQESGAGTVSGKKPEFKVPAKVKPLEERSKTFTKPASVGADNRAKEAVRKKKFSRSAEPEEPPVEEAASAEASADESADSKTEEMVEAGEAPDAAVAQINFEPGKFLSAVIEGEEEADEVRALMEKLEVCEKDERRNILTSLTSVYWRLVDSMGRRVGKENLAWEKRLCLRYGMIDESLMPDRMDFWNKLYMDKSSPGDTGVYYTDEWLEAIYKGQFKFSTIDEMALDGKKPNQNARGEEALSYEILNVPQMQRMCVGARANTIAVMTQEYCNPSRDAPMLDRAWIQQALKEALSCDHIMFNRKHKGEEKVVEPLFIMTPGYGQRAGCWEPYQMGKKGDTGPRICYCLFPPRKPMKTFLMGIADYRWEYAKADAMHYWLSEGLTGKWIALFNKKEQRKDLKEIFIDSYFLWVTYEAKRVPKLEKRFREFLYTNCPFSDEVKQTLKGGGMFARMIELEEKKKQREEEERQEIERQKAEKEARKAARKAKMEGG